MGILLSKPPSPPPRPLTDEPWRDQTDWSAGRQQRLINDIERITPDQKPNLLFIGPVGAGKSSFINSALSIGKGHVAECAGTGAAEKSYTVVYEKYTERTLLRHFRLRDCMGIEPRENEGFHVNDIVYLVKGHVKDRYTFNPRKEIDENDTCFRRNPRFEHQTHCVVFVVNAIALYNGIPDRYVTKIAALQEKIKRLGVPRVLLLTHADQLCEEVDRDIRNLFRSVKVQRAVNVASEVFHIPISAIHPVVNYAVRIELDTKTNIALLLAMRQMMQFANDRVEKEADHSDSDDD